MITNLKKVDPQIQAGREIEVVEYNIRNYRLHQVLEQLSRCLLFGLECDSNNTSSKSIPSDTGKLLEQWQAVKGELDFSIDHNDFPVGSHEYAYTINLLNGTELARIRNVKLKAVLTEIFHTARVILSLDSAGTQGYIALEDEADIRKAMSVVDDKAARWIGDGSIEKTGLKVPAYEILGTVLPDVDNDYAKIMEPSKTMPKAKLPDVQDTSGGAE